MEEVNLSGWNTLQHIAYEVGLEENEWQMYRSGRESIFPTDTDIEHFGVFIKFHFKHSMRANIVAEIMTRDLEPIAAHLKKVSIRWGGMQCLDLIYKPKPAPRTLKKVTAANEMNSEISSEDISYDSAVEEVMEPQNSCCVKLSSTNKHLAESIQPVTTLTLRGKSAADTYSNLLASAKFDHTLIETLQLSNMAVDADFVQEISKFSKLKKIEVSNSSMTITTNGPLDLPHLKELYLDINFGQNNQYSAVEKMKLIELSGVFPFFFEGLAFNKKFLQEVSCDITVNDTLVIGINREKLALAICACNSPQYMHTFMAQTIQPEMLAINSCKIESLPDSIVALKELVLLNVEFGKEISSEFLNNLTELHELCVWFEDKSKAQKMDSLNRLANLRTISFGNVRLKSIPQFTACTQLNLHLCKVTNEIAENIAAFFPHLIFVTLDHTYARDGNMIGLFNQFVQLPTVRKCRICGFNKFDDSMRESILQRVDFKRNTVWPKNFLLERTAAKQKFAVFEIDLDAMPTITFRNFHYSRFTVRHSLNESM